MKKWTVELENGRHENVQADIVTYDQAANLCFYNERQSVIQKPGQDGVVHDLVLCIHRDKYVKYYPTPTEH